MEERFFYERTSEHVQLETSGDLASLAAEIGYLVRNIYASLMKSDPAAACLFKKMVITAIAHPKTPTWDASKARADTAVVISVPKP